MNKIECSVHCVMYNKNIVGLSNLFKISQHQKVMGLGMSIGISNASSYYLHKATRLKKNVCFKRYRTFFIFDSLYNVCIKQIVSIPITCSYINTISRTNVISCNLFIKMPKFYSFPIQMKMHLCKRKLSHFYHIAMIASGLISLIHCFGLF
jgi:hypothetical protein